MSSFRLSRWSLEPVFFRLLLVNHVPLLGSHGLTFHFATFGGCWLTGLKDSEVGKIATAHHKLLILLLKLLLDGLLIKPYLLVVGCFRGGCCWPSDNFVFEVSSHLNCDLLRVSILGCGCHVGEFPRSCRLGRLGCADSDGAHTLNDLLILIRVNSNLWIVDYFGSAFHVFA